MLWRLKNAVSLYVGAGSKLWYPRHSFFRAQIGLSEKHPPFRDLESLSDLINSEHLTLFSPIIKLPMRGIT